MGLSDKQLKFLEDFILRRHVRLGGAEHDPPEGVQAAQQDRQDRQDRAAQKAEILQKLAGISALNQGLPEEQQQRAELAEQVRAPLGDEIPTRAGLEKAGDALNRLSAHVDDVQKDIDRVRRPRFEKGQAALAALKLISLEVTEHCPEAARQDLVSQHAEVAQLLAPMRDWAKVTLWDAEDLIGINDRLDKLAQSALTLRQDVEQAVKALLAAKEAAGKSMNPSAGSGFSDAQSAQLQEMFSGASDQAAKNVLQADESIKQLENLVRHAATTTRLRTAVGKRIDALPERPPTGTTVAQRTEWHRLRSDALAAADEVLDL